MPTLSIVIHIKRQRMCPSKLLMTFLLCTPLPLLLCFVTILTCTKAQRIYHFCLNSGNFTPNDPYDLNLRQLKSYLTHHTPPTGFALGSKGQNRYQTYGHALCHGDMSPTKCKACVSEASNEVGKLCPNDKGAIIWYNNCEVKYLSDNYLSKVDPGSAFFACSGENASDPISFAEETSKWLVHMSRQASLNTEMYQAGSNVVVDGGGGLAYHGLAHCTRDFSVIDCKKCLEYVIPEVLHWCNGNKGARFVTGSCCVRYENHEFVGI